MISGIHQINTNCHYTDNYRSIFIHEIPFGALCYVKSAAGYCNVKIKTHYTNKMHVINKLKLQQYMKK